MDKILEILKENKIICGFIFLGLLVFLFGGLYLTEVTAEESFSCPKLDTLLETEDEKEMYVVDVKGAVSNPGVYRIQKGAIVQDAINMAGGLKSGANTDNLNLGKAVTDEMVITVFTEEEMNEYNVEKSPISETTKTENTTSKGLVNLNTATLEELETLPGIGESKAKLIIKYRETCGDILKKEELKNIKGIGESIYAKIEKYITV